jgi:hypothetical protein
VSNTGAHTAWHGSVQTVLSHYTAERNSTGYWRSRTIQRDAYAQVVDATRGTERHCGPHELGLCARSECNNGSRPCVHSIVRLRYCRQTWRGSDDRGGAVGSSRVIRVTGAVTAAVVISTSSSGSSRSCSLPVY